MRATLCLALVVLAGPRATAAGDDARPIIERGFAAAEANAVLERLYVYHQTIEERHFGSKGREKKRESRTWDVTRLDGSEYRRLIAQNGRPLDEHEQAAEQRRLEKQLDKMRRETPSQRAQRLRSVEREHEESRGFFEQVTRAFDFQLLREEPLDGVPCYVIAAEPRADYEPVSRETRVLTKVRATLWISQSDSVWVRAEIETIESFTWAMVLRVKPGAQVQFSRRRVNDEVWLPHTWYLRYKGKAAGIFGFNREFSASYDNYRKFTAESSGVFDGGAR
ncbi:MAG TPA: hypothetical protein VD788_15655 [Candidatus Polarisedimenticolaceae bacterium]|nr:hypothetical protein [Candidatus Polarisedimenticolaceae bacterium]